MSDAPAVDTSTETAAESTPAVDPMDAALDAALAKAGQSAGEIVPSDPDAQAAPSTGPARGADGKFVSKKVDDPPAPAASESKHSDDEIRRATAAAQRVAGKDGLPKSISDAIKSGDTETIAHYLKLAKVQQDGDDFSTKHKTLQQELEALKKSANSGTQGKVDATASQADMDEAVDPLASYLVETLGDEKAAEHLRASFASHQKAIVEHLTAQHQQQLGSLQAKVEAMEDERARAELLSEYPDLKDKSVWDAVLKQASTLPESESRPDRLTRIQHAALIELGPTLAKRAREEREQRNTKRDLGSPTAPMRTAESKGNQNPERLHDDLLDALEKGDAGRIKELKAAINTQLRS